MQNQLNTNNVSVKLNGARVVTKNGPKLSEFTVQTTYNERRLRLVPEIKRLIETSHLFANTEITVEFTQKRHFIAGLLPRNFFC